MPLGLRPGPLPGTLAASYPPGLPLHMAVAARIGGWGRAPFLAVPAMALLALVLLYLVGRELDLPPLLSASGAVLLAACPIFFGEAIQPMSDVVAAAWALAAILFGLKSRSRPGWAFAAGAALGIGLLVRPTNLLVAIPLAFALPSNRRTFLRALVGFAPVAAGLALYNLKAFGHLAETGYGGLLRFAMSPAHVLPNFRHYGYWVPVLLTPLLALAWIAVPFDRRVPRRDRSLLVSWFAVFFLFYSFYEVFDDWWAVRFLLPGIPAMILSALLAARGIRLRMSGGRWKTAAGLALLAGMAALGAYGIGRFDLLSVAKGEAIYRTASREAARIVPAGSVVVSMQMSGALHYYTGLSVARWDLLDPARFASLRGRIEAGGSRLYALLWPFEEEAFFRNVPGRWSRIAVIRDIGLWRLD